MEPEKSAILNDLAVYVGDNVKQIMQRKHITNPEMAKLLNLSVSQIKKIRKGDSLLEIQHGMVICREFHVNMERLYPVDLNLPLFKTEDGEAGKQSFEDVAQTAMLMINDATESDERRRMFAYLNELTNREQLKYMK